MTAPLLWHSAEAAVALAIFVALMLDAVLEATGRPTISVWLRAHPKAFWTAYVVFQLFLLELIVHLFIMWWL